MAADAFASPLRRERRAERPRGEQRLLSEAQRGSEEALEKLFRMHWSRAHRAAYLIVRDAGAAEDIAQEAFLSAIRSLDRFDRRRPFAPWFHRIVVNRAIDFARTRSIRREVGVDVEVFDQPHTDHPTEPYSNEVTDALAGLAPEHRAVVVMRYLLEYTPGEIAKALGLPRGTVNSRIRRGLDRLALELGDEVAP